MFNYEHECVINSAADLGGKTASVTDDALIIPRIGNYILDNIKNACYVAPVASACGVYTLPAIAAPSTADKIVRVTFKIACSGKYAEFALANWHAFEKPIMVEFVADGTRTPLIEALKLVIEPDVATFSGNTLVLAEPIFSIDASTFKAVALSDGSECTCAGYVDDSESPVTATLTVTTAPNEGVGTYEQIINNLRFPTHENLRYASPSAMPVPGALYRQYSFDYEVERQAPSGGLSAVGQVLTSRTHHVLFVKDDFTALKTVLTSADVFDVTENGGAEPE